MKTCTLCKTPKPLSEFTKDKNGKDGLKTGCRPCLTKQKRESRHRNPEPNRKACKKWAEKNPEKVREYGKNYRAQLPREVLRARYNKWAEQNPDRVALLAHRSKLKCKYGLTVEEYRRLDEAQGHVCAICGTRPEEHLSVDHCHKTGKIRGLLCRPCNFGIGIFKDCPYLLAKALEYLWRVK